MNAGISRDEWLKALAEAGKPEVDDQGALTILEFGAMFGFARETASRRLRALEKAGKAKQTWKRTSGVDGRQVRAVAYRLVS